MLHELRIENLLLIERAELRFGPGLNVITGETGAGKTVLAQSLDLLTGGRPRGGIVRPGAAEAWVEGTFDLPSSLREDPDLAELAERQPNLLYPLLRSQDAWVRRGTAELLGTTRRPAEEGMLQPLLTDPAPEVIEAASEAIRRLRAYAAAYPGA